MNENYQMEFIEDCKARASFSGGKDSAAMVIMLLQKGYPLDSIDFIDSEWEYPETYAYIERFSDYIEKNWGMRVNKLTLKEDWKFERWFYGKYLYGKNEGKMRGFPRVLGHCYLSRQKGRTLDRYDRSAQRYLGIGWNERHRVGTNPMLLYPLVEWKVTEEDCVDFLKEIDLYPKHKNYYTRQGCYWCPKQSKKSAYSLYIRHPDLWNKLKELEKLSPHGWNLPGRETNEIELQVFEDLQSEKIDLDLFLDDRTLEERETARKRIIKNGETQLQSTK
jgi:3'-phosphoadenosine 5'-phosphosulfate sulfotransferase (PAPS reductase)/FAD synthetase